MPSSPRIIKSTQSFSFSGPAAIQTLVPLPELEDLDADDSYEQELHSQRSHIRDLLREAERQKAALLAEARKEAETLGQQAYQEGKAAGQQSGYEAGFEKGYREALQKAEAEVAALHETAVRKVQEATRDVAAYEKQHKDELIALAAVMAEKIVHDQIDTSQERILKLIEPALKRIGRQSHFVSITVPDELAELVRSRIGEWEKTYTNVHFVVFADKRLAKNGCLIEGDHAIVDLQIEKQLQAMVADLQQLEADGHA